MQNIKDPNESPKSFRAPKSFRDPIEPVILGKKRGAKAKQRPRFRDMPPARTARQNKPMKGSSKKGPSQAVPIRRSGNKIVLGDKAHIEHRANEMRAKHGYTHAMHHVEQGGGVHRPHYSKGKLHQASMPQVMSAWDEMLVAKYYPGQFNVPYVAGMNVTNLPTTTFSVSNSISDANVYGNTTDSPLGSTPYTLVMWSTSMTAFYGDGGTGNVSSSDKLGGLVIKQVEAADLDTPWISRDAFQEVQSSFTMIDTYGSDMTGFSAGGYVWAGSMDVNILTPRANLVGSYFSGTLQYGQLPDTQSNGLSLRQLVEIAGDIEILQPQFHLRTGVVNHNIVYASQDQSGGQLRRNDFVGELINYVILFNVAENITTGEPSQYALQMNMKGNGVFWAKPQDSIANNLYKKVAEKKSAMPGMLTGVGQDTGSTPKPVNTLWEGAKHLASQMYQDAGGLSGIASTAASLLLDPVPQQPPKAYLVRSNYMDALLKANEAVSKVHAQNPSLNLDGFNLLFKQQIQFLRTHTGRIIAIEDDDDQDSNEEVSLDAGTTTQTQPQTRARQLETRSTSSRVSRK